MRSVILQLARLVRVSVPAYISGVRVCQEQSRIYKCAAPYLLIRTHFLVCYSKANLDSTFIQLRHAIYLVLSVSDTVVYKYVGIFFPVTIGNPLTFIMETRYKKKGLLLLCILDNLVECMPTGGTLPLTYAGLQGTTSGAPESHQQS